MRRVPGPHKKIFTLWRGVIDFVREKVNAHRVDYDPSNPRDYIDCFLGEMERVRPFQCSGNDNQCWGGTSYYIIHHLLQLLRKQRAIQLVTYENVNVTKAVTSEYIHTRTDLIDFFPKLHTSVSGA